MFVVIFKPANLISESENRKLSVFHKPHLNTILDGTFQKNFDKAFEDQFYYRHQIINSYKRFEANQRAFFDGFKASDGNELELYSLGNNVFQVGKNGKKLMELFMSDFQNTINTIDQKIYNYNYFVQQFPKPKYYIYRVLMPQDYEWFDEANDFVSYGSKYRTHFKKQLDPKITYLEDGYQDLNDFLNYGYYSDHHLNYLGAQRTYQTLIKAFSQEFNLGPVKKEVDKFCLPTKFYGSFSKRINYTKPDIYDQLCDLKYELKDHDIYVNNQKVTQLGNKTSYHNNTYDPSDQINRYADYFGYDQALITFDYKNNTGVNALIISDSYTNAFKEVLASHFDRSFFVDPRHFHRDFGSEFKYSEFIKKERIDLVLVLGGTSSVFLDGTFNFN